MPHGGYFQREVPPDDAELTRVGPGTPCGEYLRRFWQPVAFARDLGDVPLRLAHHGRGSRALPRRRAAGSGCSTCTACTAAPRWSTGIIAERGPPVLLPRLALRRGRRRSRDARGAGGQHVSAPDLPGRLSDARVRGADLRVSRARRTGARRFPLYDTLRPAGFRAAGRPRASSCRATGSRSRTTAWTPCTRPSCMR